MGLVRTPYNPACEPFPIIIKYPKSIFFFSATDILHKKSTFAVNEAISSHIKIENLRFITSCYFTLLPLSKAPNGHHVDCSTGQSQKCSFRGYFGPDQHQ